MTRVNGGITLLFNSDGLHIQLHDKDSCITFADVQLTQKQTCQAMARLSRLDCDTEYADK